MEGIQIEELGPEDFQEYKDTIAEDKTSSTSPSITRSGNIFLSMSSISSIPKWDFGEGWGDRPSRFPSVYVEGLTLEEARQQLRQEYRKEISDVELFISYKERRRA